MSENKITISEDGIHNTDYVKVPCPTCKRKGTVTDPACFGKLIGYYNPHTGDRFPQVKCETCNGSGWILKPISQV